MKRLMMLLAVLSIGYVAGAGLPNVMQAQGGQGREGGANPNAGRGQAPGGIRVCAAFAALSPLSLHDVWQTCAGHVPD